MTKAKIVLDELTDGELWALAQMWDDFKRLSANESEREDMLRRALAEAGVDPR